MSLEKTLCNVVGGMRGRDLQTRWQQRQKQLTAENAASSRALHQDGVGPRKLG